MKRLRYIILLLLLFAITTDAVAQKKKQKNQVTPANAREKEHKNMEEKQAQYVGSKNHHKKIQDKQTQKRMKKNLKMAQKHSWGKDVPWYKRWFKRKKI